MTDKCQYPNCRTPLVSYLHRGGKTVGLCDQHLDHLLSEHRKLVMTTEKALKIPPIETGARMAKPEEEDYYCCAPGCNHSAALFYGTKPVCHEHAKNHEYIPFDGTYRKRKIIVIERPGASEKAVVMKGEGTGDEKREKKRKIYPVNPTRGIPLPAKEAEVPDQSAEYDAQAEMVDDESVPDQSAEYDKQAEMMDKEEFVEAVEQAPEDDINAILARLNSGELEMPED